MNFACVFATWFGAETLLSISATFTKDGFQGIPGDPFGATACLTLVGIFFARDFYRMDLLTHRRLLPQTLWQVCRGGDVGRYYDFLSRLDLGPNDRPGLGDFRFWEIAECLRTRF